MEDPVYTVLRHHLRAVILWVPTSLKSSFFYCVGKHEIVVLHLGRVIVRAALQNAIMRDHLEASGW